MFRKLCLLRRQLTYPLNEIKRREDQFQCLDPRITYLGMVNPPGTCRNFAKGRDIKKEKKKKVHIDENELREVFDYDKLMQDVTKPVDFFKQNLTEHISLRSNQSAIENIKFNLDGDPYTIKDLAEVGKKNPKLYVLDFTAFPQAIPVVIETLQKSEMNFNVQQDGTRLFIPIVKVTREHRELLAKKAKAHFVNCKDAVRNVQLKYIKNLKNIEKLSVDSKFRVTDQLTALGDKQISLAEEILKEKQDELLNLEKD